jgi:hypothetical protein
MREPINLRHQLERRLSRGFEHELEREKMIWQNETNANFSDQVAAVVSVTGDGYVTFPPAMSVMTSILDWITHIGITYFIATEYQMITSIGSAYLFGILYYIISWSTCQIERQKHQVTDRH